MRKCECVIQEVERRHITAISQWFFPDSSVQIGNSSSLQITHGIGRGCKWKKMEEDSNVTWQKLPN